MVIVFYISVFKKLSLLINFVFIELSYDYKKYATYDLEIDTMKVYYFFIFKKFHYNNSLVSVNKAKKYCNLELRFMQGIRVRVCCRECCEELQTRKPAARQIFCTIQGSY